MKIQVFCSWLWIETHVKKNGFRYITNRKSIFAGENTSVRRTLHTLRTLIRKYKKQIGGVDDVCVISGGLQQYLIKKDYNMRRVEESVDTNNDRRTSITFSDLPVSKTYHKSFHLITKFVFNHKSLVCEKLLNDF